MSDAPLWVQSLSIFMFVGVPILLLALGISLLMKTRRFMRNAQRVMGTVTHIEQTTGTHDGQPTTTYHPTFSFQTDDGVTHSAKTATASSVMNYAIGSQRQILVNPDMLDQVRMPRFWVWGMSVIITLFGVFVAVFGLFFFFGS